MSLSYCLPYGLWIMYFRVVQGIALNPGVCLASVKLATRRLYTLHRGTDFTRFCCEKVEASKRRSEDCTGEREPRLPPRQHNTSSRTKRDPERTHPSAERGVGGGGTWWTLFGSRV